MAEWQRALHRDWERKHDPEEPEADWVDTSAGFEQDSGSPSAGWTVGSGANPITRAGLPNADPDGLERDDVAAQEIGPNEPLPR